MDAFYRKKQISRSVLNIQVKAILNFSIALL